MKVAIWILAHRLAALCLAAFLGASAASATPGHDDIIKGGREHAHMVRFLRSEAFDSFLDTMDSDCDGLTDLDERYMGTNPRSSDSDGDGISDWSEVIGPAAEDALALPHYIIR